MAKPAKKPAPPKPDKGTPGVMIMIGLKPGNSDEDDLPKSAPSKKPAATSSLARPSNSGKVPSFGGKTRRTWTGS